MGTDEAFDTYLTKLATTKWPRWSDLPQFDLYMDQVVQFANELIVPTGLGELTPTMVNNYVKKGIIKAPLKKKYSRSQLANVIVVAILKSVFSLDTIADGIKYQLLNRNSHQAYDAFIVAFAGAIQKASSDFHGEVVINGVTREDTTKVQTAMVNLAINSVIEKLLVETMARMTAPDAEPTKKNDKKK
ncbi:DUF1836 domain-containing protein [Lacticaseibacillus hulanensis]|uniref:DUF1836 domain-containing protein n=1 Tax=Lacticaseibacillus hulanensis TaxID=2493111 RepID=UPI000FDCC1F3|nr:DUF1836 domain-containing protein [Lacticaseibacillus hulanensis]